MVGIRTLLSIFFGVMLSLSCIASEAIDINEVSAKEIAAALKGIGLKKAEAIVAFREEFGAFETIESITQVKGIGAKTLARNEGRIVISRE